MIPVISTGNNHLDAALGTGGLPIGRLVEVSGLQKAELSHFIENVVDSMKSDSTEVIDVSQCATQEDIAALVSPALLESPAVIIVKSVNGPASDLLSSELVANWLLSVAADHHIAIVCGMAFSIRLNNGLRPTATGLASIADLRLQVYAEATGGFRARVVKNRLAKPGAEAAIG